MPEYQIKGWEKHFENSRTRELKRMDFILVPNKHDGDGFRTLISKPRGTALFGAWVLILQVASKCEPRGRLVRSDGSPHTAETIARITGGDEKLIKAALDVLMLPEIGWIEDVGANDAFEIPPARSASAVDKRKAVGRLDRFLVPDRGVSTPKGKVTERPLQCQWCDTTPSPAFGGQPGIVAHHVLGYGTLADDLSVVFVCRSCHGFFESGKYTTKMVMDKFGTEWAHRNTAGDSQNVAGDSGPHARAPNRTEGNGREENGTEPTKGACAITLWQNPKLFEAWWEMWSRSRGTNHKPQAVQAWISVVTGDNAEAVFKCTASYLDSRLPGSSGYNPENFLFDQSRDGFAARWPPARAPVDMVQERKSAEREKALRRIAEEQNERRRNYRAS